MCLDMRRHRILGWNRDHHVYVVAQQVPFFDPAFLLLGQFPEHLAQVLAELPVQHLASAF